MNMKSVDRSGNSGATSKQGTASKAKGSTGEQDRCHQWPPAAEYHMYKLGSAVDDSGKPVPFSSDDLAARLKDLKPCTPQQVGALFTSWSKLELIVKVAPHNSTRPELRGDLHWLWAGTDLLRGLPGPWIDPAPMRRNRRGTVA